MSFDEKVFTQNLPGVIDPNHLVSPGSRRSVRPLLGKFCAKPVPLYDLILLIAPQILRPSVQRLWPYYVVYVQVNDYEIIINQP